MELILCHSLKKLGECKWDKSETTFCIGKQVYKIIYRFGGEFSSIFVFSNVNSGLEELQYCNGVLLSRDDVLVNITEKRVPTAKEINDLFEESSRDRFVLASTLKSEYSLALVRILSGIKAKRVTKHTEKKKSPLKTASVASSLDDNGEEESEEDEDEEEEDDED